MENGKGQIDKTEKQDINYKTNVKVGRPEEQYDGTNLVIFVFYVPSDPVLRLVQELLEQPYPLMFERCLTPHQKKENR